MKISQKLKWFRRILAITFVGILLTTVISNITDMVSAVAPVDASKWNLGLELFDSTIGDGTTSLTEDIITVDQPHGGYADNRRITLQINYEAIDLDRSYGRNELELKLEMPIKLMNLMNDGTGWYYHVTNDLGMDYSFMPYSISSSEVGASAYQANIDQYDWSYSCPYRTDYTLPQVCTFKNNKTIEKNSSIRGTIQIVYNLSDTVGFMNAPLFVDHFNINYRQSGKATLNESVASNTVVFGINHERDVEWEKELYSLGINPYKLDTFDGFTAEQASNYTWVHYYYYGTAYPAPYYDLNSNRYVTYGPTTRTPYEAPYAGTDTPEENYKQAQAYSNIPVKDWRWIDKLGGDVLVLDRNLNEIEPDQDGNYLVAKTEAINYEKCKFRLPGYSSEITPGSCYEIYVGYPKDIYNEANNNYYIEGTAYSMGTYFQTDSSLPDNEEEQLASATRAISLSDFEIEYQGNQIGLTKQMIPYQGDKIVLNSDEFKTSEGANIKYQFDAKASNITQTPYDITLGDDIIYYEDTTTGLISKLPESDYEYKTISAYYKMTYSDGEVSKCENLGIEIYYRLRGETEMRQLSMSATGIHSSHACGEILIGNTWYSYSWDLPAGTVAWKLVIPGLSKGVENLRYGTSLNIKSNNLPTNGKLHNFAYAQVLHDGRQLNVADLSNYSEGVTRDIIAAYDIATYGQYMQRALDSYAWEPFEMGPIIHNRYLSLQTGSQNLRYNASTDSFDGKVDGYFYAYDYTLSGEKNWELLKAKGGDDLYIKEIESYVLVPNGVKLKSSTEDIINSISDCQIAPGGWNANSLHEPIFDTKYECLQYLKSHTTVTITENWHDSGQTHIKIYTDFSEKPFSIINSLYSPSSTVSLFSIDLNIGVPYELWNEFDKYNSTNTYSFPVSSYTYNDGSWQYDPDNYTGAQYGVDNNYSPSYYNYYGDRWLNVPPAGYKNLLPTVTDVNDNGVTTERFRFVATGLQSIGAISAEEIIRQSVITDQLNSYTTDSAYVSAGGNYNYKLLLRTGATRAYDAVVYSNLETAFGNNEHWQGTFDGVDTSAADGLLDSNGKTVKVKTLYSTNPNAGSPNTDNSWHEYIEGTTDKTTVKSVAFRYLTEDGTPASIPGSTAVYGIVRLKAPSTEPSNVFAYNDFRSEWHDINTSNDINTELHTLHSNITQVQIDNKIAIKVVKEWIDSNNKYNTRPSTVTPTLRRNSELVNGTSSINIAQGENTLTYSDLHEYYKDQYNVTLNTIPNYTTRLKSYDGDTMTYIFESRLKTDKIKVINIWEDNQNIYNRRPENVKFDLLYNNVVDQSHQITTTNDTEEFYFEELPAHIIRNFSVATDSIDGYTTTLDVSDDGKTYTFTHKLTATVKISVKHIWDDENNVLGIRPNTIHFDRYHDEDADEYIVLETENTEEESQFTEVPLLELENYLVKMVPIGPYVTTMEYDPETYTYTFTSWIRPEPSDDDVPVVPNTGDSILQHIVTFTISFTLCALAITKIRSSTTRNSSNRHS